MDIEIPEWDCQADDNQVICAKCGEQFCPGCCEVCPACNYDKVIRDKRWDEEARELERFMKEVMTT